MNKIKEQYREPAAPATSKSDVQKNIQAIGMISQQIQKLNPRQKESAMIEMSRHFASEAEDEVDTLPDKVIETIMFLDTEPKQSIKYVVKNVPYDIVLKWLTSYRSVFDSVKKTFPDKA